MTETEKQIIHMYLDSQVLHGSVAEQLKNTFNSKSNMNLFLELIGDCRTYEEQCFFYFLF